MKKSEGKDTSWKGFKTFLGFFLIIIQVILLLFQQYNCKLVDTEIVCSLRHLLGLDGGFFYTIGRNFLLIIGILLLYFEKKEFNNYIRYILIIIITVLILAILGY